MMKNYLWNLKIVYQRALGLILETTTTLAHLEVKFCVIFLQLSGQRTASIFKGVSATAKPGTLSMCLKKLARSFDTLRDNCWNEAFQLLLEWQTPTPQEQLSKFVAIGNLMEAFIAKGKEVNLANFLTLGCKMYY